MTVYIELVFLENFIIDYFLLLSAEKITYIPCRHPVLASLLGGIYAVFMPLFTKNTVMTLLVLIIMCIVCFASKKPQEIIKTSFAALIIASALYGILDLFFFKFKAGFFYEDNIFFVLALISSLFSIGTYRLLIPFMREKKLRENLVTVNLCGKDFLALIDSGNSLYYKDIPVILINKNSLNHITLPVKPIIIPYSTVGEGGALMGFKPENVSVTYMGKTKKLNCVVALCAHNFKKSFDALMHPDLIKECV